jgi:glucosamine--fructose-6-phosphate aminotransferase (isomerizing)
MALLNQTISRLDGRDWLVIRRNRTTFRILFGKESTKIASARNPAFRFNLGKSGCRRFMLREMFEQPQRRAIPLRPCRSPPEADRPIPELTFGLHQPPYINMVACGISYSAAKLGNRWIQSLARNPVDAEAASEFGYSSPVLAQGGVSEFISQTGETADTMAALSTAINLGQSLLSIVNVRQPGQWQKDSGCLKSAFYPKSQFNKAVLR